MMTRGTFANVRLKNRLAPGTEGWWTTHLATGEKRSVYEAAIRYQKEGVPLLVLAGKEYGSGSSRDWAAKGPALLGVKAVLAQSFERIHRSNLVGMGILPLEFTEGRTAESLALTGKETFDLLNLDDRVRSAQIVEVKATGPDGRVTTFRAKVRIDTPIELDYYRHGGILPYVLRQILRENQKGSDPCGI